VATFSDMPENETGRGNPESLMKMAAEALALHLYRLIKTHGATAIRYPNRRIRAGHIFRRIRLKENPPPGYRREPGRFTANRPREDHVKDN
jgi:hypothetical protein